MASISNLDEFIGNPSVEELKEAKITKNDLKYIAKNFNISFSSDIRKEELRTLILTHLGEEAPAPSPPMDSNLQLEIEKVKMQALQMKLEYEKNEKEKEREENQRKREHELAMARVTPPTQIQTEHKTKIHKYLPLLPQFSDKDPDTFFGEFESSAEHFELPREDWTWLLKPKLSPKALTILNGLENATDYDLVKSGILAAYSITTEGYRQKFRQLSKSPHQTYLEFASEKLRSLRKWLKSAAVTTYDELVNIIALEEFKRKLPYSVMLHITNKDETDLIKAAQLADVFALVNRPASSRERKTETPTVKSEAGSSGSAKPVGSGSQTLVCSFCKQPGHLIKNCPNPKCKVAKTPPSKPVASLQVSTTPHNDPFQPFRSTGTVHIDPHKVHTVRIVRDTCSAQSILLKSALPDIEQSYTGEKVYIKDFHQPFSLPLAKVRLDCPLVKGEVIVGVSDDSSLPIPESEFLLANDLAGGSVTPPLVISETLLTHNPTLHLEEQQPHLFPVCVTTRAQSKRADQSQTSLPKGSLSSSEVNQIFTNQVLREAQQEDSTLSKFYSRVTPKDQITHYPSFYEEEQILMRVFRPAKASDEASWAEVHQIVLPTMLRQPVLEIAHENFAGHLGIKKTCEKILANFYWPGLREDVKSYVNSCHTCQIAGKPNQTIPPYPLQPIAVPLEPFNKIIIDIVGPLPRTKKGNQYILTVLDPTTRYPEAFPIKNITSRTIVSKLRHLFTTFGIPQEIQSDQGTNFTSDLFRAVLNELGISQTLSTAYHPQSQGALERCHQTLKSLLRKFCHEQPLEWDEALPYVLFAIREAPNESLGVSPFELLFGRKVRGPLRIVKDKLLDTTTHKLVSVTKYLDNLKSTLSKVRTFARDNLKQAQHSMKANFDKKAKIRTFNEGDEVLAFIPAPKAPLQIKYHGPYNILQKVGDNNYVISTPDRRKSKQLIHVNLLKLYKPRAPVSQPSSGADSQSTPPPVS